MMSSPQSVAADRVGVAIIGAGISGIGAAIRLLQEGSTDFVVLEKAQSLGGTWRDNTYPGCACDVPSVLYSYTFAQRADWSRVFAAQPEILDYIRDTSHRHGVDRYIRYDEPVEHASWNETAGCWIVRSSKKLYHARVLLVCTGYLHEPQIPNLPGLSDFPGKVFHSSRWDYGCDLRGKRVAVIGTGASAVQFVPEIQPQVAELRIYQRTAQWILPKSDAPIPGLVQALFKVPFLLPAWRAVLYLIFETFGIGFRHPSLLQRMAKVARAHLHKQIQNPTLRRLMTPHYTLGCKRVLLSNNYYPALAQANVEVLGTGVREVRASTVVGLDGSEREVDVIILGTGFHVTDQPIAPLLHGVDGRSLAQVWAGSPKAYRGTTVSGFPNLFLVLGPNLAIGHNSAFIIIEAQLDYIMSALRTMRRKSVGRVEVDGTVQADYNKLVQRKLLRTVWNSGGCSSYYIDETGTNSTGFPWSTLKMRRLLARFDLQRYRTNALPPGGPAS